MAPDIIHSATADQSAGPYPISLPSQPMKQWGQMQASVDGRLLGLLGPYHQHAIGTFNTCSQRRGLQPWRCRLATYHSPTFPTNGLHFPPKCSSDLQFNKFVPEIPKLSLRILWPPRGLSTTRPSTVTYIYA
jgi:hypothetical protein